MSRSAKSLRSPPRYKAPALEKGLEILERLSAAVVPLSQTEIAESLGRGPNEIYRMLACLLRRGYVVRDAASGKYRLSLRLYELGHTHSPMESVIAAAFAPMRELTEEVRQSVHLSTIEDDHLIVLQQVRSPQPICLSVEEGARFSLLETASGKMLLAMLAAEDREMVLESSAEYRALSSACRRRLSETLARCRTQGHVLAPSEQTPGVLDVAVHVGLAKTRSGAALAISAIGIDSDTRHQQRLLRAAEDAAKSINQALGVIV